MSAEAAVPGRIDWARAEAWSACLARGELDPVRKVFRKHGARGPEVVWRPQARQINTTPLRALLEYWLALKPADGLPSAERIDPLCMREALGYVMLVDVVENGVDFRYRLFGSAIAAVSGFDMTGRLLSTHTASEHILEFSLALYRAALWRREAAFCQYAPAGTLLTSQWQRLALPLVDSSGTITRFLAGTVPVGRNGSIVAMRL